jgi:hypothetical protein
MKKSNLEKTSRRPLTSPSKFHFGGVLDIESFPFVDNAQADGDLASPARTIKSLLRLRAERNKHEHGHITVAQGQDLGGHTARAIRSDILRTVSRSAARTASDSKKGSHAHAQGDSGNNDKENIMSMPEFGLQAKSSKALLDSKLARMKLIHSGVNVVNNLPLAYLFSRPELRVFGLDRAGRILLKPAIASLRALTEMAMFKWKNLPEKPCDDRQVGSIVIAKCFSNLLEKCMRRKFEYWAYVCSDRFRDARLSFLEDSARDIQQWWRHMQIVTKYPWRRLSHAIEICLNRRRAIRHIIAFEQTRNQGSLAGTT